MRTERQQVCVQVGLGSGSDLLLWLVLALPVGVQWSRASNVLLMTVLVLEVAEVHCPGHDFIGQSTSLMIAVSTSAARADSVLVGVRVGVLVGVLAGVLVGVLVGVRGATANTVRRKSTQRCERIYSYFNGPIKL